MSASNEKFCQKKTRISQPVLIVVSGTLLAMCNGAALALELNENTPAIEASSALFPTLSTQPIPVPDVSATNLGSPYSPDPINAVDPHAESAIHRLETDTLSAQVSRTAVDIALEPPAEEPMADLTTQMPGAVQMPGVVSSEPIAQLRPLADVPVRLAELIEHPAAASPVSPPPIAPLRPLAEVPVPLAELAINPAVHPVVNPAVHPAAPEATAIETPAESTLPPSNTFTSLSTPIPTFQPSNNPVGVAQLIETPAESTLPPIGTVRSLSAPIPTFQPSHTPMLATPPTPAVASLAAMDQVGNPDAVSESLNAQSSEPEDAAPDAVPEPVSYSAADLLEVPSRFGVNASTATNGFGETIGVHGFIPLDQDLDADLSESDVTFLEGNLQVNDGDPSISLSLGHRGYRRAADNPDDEYIRGGYIGVDGRFTDESSFFQLASGYERINDDWEFRINGYLPIGDRTNTIRSVDFDTGLETSSGFQGNQLVLSAVRERQRILQQEDALGGFDAELGTKLDEWDGGELMGYAGGYLLSGEESSLGGQLRLAANFESNFNVGLSLQHDGIFDTTIALSLSATWPQFRFQDQDEADFAEAYEVPIRLRDPISRRQNVAVNVINEEEIILEDDSAPLQNPEEEEDYRFVHVNLGAPEQDGIGSPGSYESPFTTVEDAIALVNSDPATYSDGNTIIYVDGENATGITIPGFTIPDRVRVLSQGPEQVIGGIEFPGFPSVDTRLPFAQDQNFNVASNAPNANGITVLLPDSGDGVFPSITGGADDLVTLGNQTVLAGFQIDGATQHGVTGSDISNIELRNNLISNSGGSGIFLNNVGGSAILFDNVVNNSADRGIFVENATTTPLEVAIAGFDLNNNRVGMDFSSLATAGAEFPSQIIWIGPSVTANTSTGLLGSTPLTNSILNSTDEGLVLRAEGDALTASSTQQLVVVDTTIDQSGGDGLQVIADVGVHQQLFGLDNAIITNNGGNGITIVNGDTAINGSVTTATPDAASPQEIVIVNSEIANNILDGIDVTLTDAGAQELVIQDNQIINNGGNGIDSTADTATVQEWRTDNDTGALGVSGNTITGNGLQAISIDLENVATLPIVGIGNNDLSGNGVGPDIEINTLNSLPAGGVNACVVVTNNIAPQGIQLTAPDPVLSGGIASVQVENLPDLTADTNVFFLVDDLTLGLTPSTAAYILPPSNCNE